MNLLLYFFTHKSREKRIADLRARRTELLERIDIPFKAKVRELNRLTDKILNLLKA